MNRPTVSVIIPTYNRQKLLRRAIDSVFAQTYMEYELIVIDDGSTDGTQKMVCEIFENKAKYHYQENQGRSAARNIGIAMANGEYIAFLDSDDVWSPEKLYYQVATFNKPANEHIVAVCSSVWRIDMKGNRIDPRLVGRVKNLAKLGLEDFFSGPKIFASPSNMCIRSETLKQVNGFDASIEYGEDWDLIIRLRSKGSFQYIDQPLLSYCVHPTGTQKIFKKENIPSYLSDKLKIIQKNAHLLPGKDQMIKKLMGKIYEEFAYRYFAVGCLAEGFDSIQQALKFGLKNPSPEVISQQVGNLVAVGALEMFENPEVAEKYFLEDFLPKFFKLWLVGYGQPPSKNQLLAWFYHNLAFLLDSSDLRMKKQYILKAIKNRPAFLFAPRSLMTFWDW